MATAETADNVAVVGVTFEVNGAEPDRHHRRAIPAHHRGAAAGLAGNDHRGSGDGSRCAQQHGVGVGQCAGHGRSRYRAPTLQLLAPAETAPGSQVLVTALAADNVGVDSVSFAIAGQSIGIDRQAAYESALRRAGSDARRIDADLYGTSRRRGRQLDRSGRVGAGHCRPRYAPPTIALSAPAETAPGATITLTASVSDNAGVAGVQFFADDVPLGIDDESSVYGRCAGRGESRRWIRDSHPRHRHRLCRPQRHEHCGNRGSHQHAWRGHGVRRGLRRSQWLAALGGHGRSDRGCQWQSVHRTHHHRRARAICDCRDAKATPALPSRGMVGRRCFAPLWCRAIAPSKPSMRA